MINIKKGVAFLTCLGVVGLFLLLSGLVVLVKYPKMLRSEVAKRLALVNGSQTYQGWVSPPLPVYIQFWFFNVSNAEAIYEGAKPIVSQIGPYTYREIRDKTNLTFKENGTVIEYVLPKSYVFEPSMSAGSENDTFTGINLPLLGLADSLQYKSAFVQALVTSTLESFHQRLFTNKTVKEYLWGYQDPFFTSAKKLLKVFAPKEADKIPDVFGMFTGPKGNGSNDGVWEVYTGTGNIEDFNKIKSWNGKSQVNYWGSKWANTINGTDGSMWEPFVQKDDTLFMFSGDICRSVSANYQSSVHIKGIPMYRFVPSKSVFEDSKTNPNNLDFCTPNCLPAGVLNMSACTGGPIVMSMPHFTEADQSVIDAIEGMHPDPNLLTWLDVEPLTGAVLHAARRMQFNAYITKLDVLLDTHKMNTTIFPIIWLNETAMLGDDTAHYLKNNMLLPIKIVTVTKFCLLAVGGIIVLVAMAIIVSSMCRNKKDKDSSKDKYATDATKSPETEALNNTIHV